MVFQAPIPFWQGPERNRESMNNTRAGFSLIELLVVISIIGVLAAVLLPNMVAMRQRARDSQVKQSLGQLKSALRLYYNDYQTYPPNSEAGDMVACGTDGTEVCASGEPLTRGGTTYMQAVPSGHVTDYEDLYYQQTGSGDGFVAAITLENLSDEEADTSSAVGSSGERCDVADGSASKGRYYVCSF